jgi:hypothetical protein
MEAMNCLFAAGLLCGLFGAGGEAGSPGPIQRTCWNCAGGNRCGPCGSCGVCRPGIFPFNLCARPCRTMDCDPCGDPCGDPCCDPCCVPCCRGRGCHDRTYCGPLTGVCSLLGALCKGGCGCGPCGGGGLCGGCGSCGGCGRGIEGWSTCGCGERYWGDFLSCPPDCCDPCDGCGNYVGRPNCGCAGPGYGYGAGQAAPRYVQPGTNGEMVPAPNGQPSKTVSPAPQRIEPARQPTRLNPKVTRRPNYPYYQYRYR